MRAFSFTKAGVPVLLIALVFAAPAKARLLFGGGLGLHFYGLEETDNFGPANIAGNERGSGLTYQLMVGGRGERLAVYGTFIGAPFSSEKPDDN